MGVDIALFSSGNPVTLRREFSEGEHVVLFVGRLIENKGCDDLLQAVALLPAKTRARTTLCIVGDGQQREPLERAARALGVSDKVRFFGTVNQQRLPEFYAAADLVAIPSKVGSSGETEGQAVVVLEAFAARACVVATAIGGIPSMVRDQVTGVLVEPANPRALASALERLLELPALRQQLAKTAFTEVSEQYGWPNIAARFAKLYREILISAHR
jgi:glycosyltransferase involved in cell wall biosynthesis